MFTVEQRDGLQECVLGIAGSDPRVLAGAIVGSLALGQGDRFSDLDLTFGIADHVPIEEMLDDWSRRLADEVGALALVDLERRPTIYRVFLLPGSLQFDLSMTPAAQFRPAGPRFRLLFGETTQLGSAASWSVVQQLFIATPVLPPDLFGWGVVYALHARACIGRKRWWQADRYIGAVRDHGLSLACLREGTTAVQARGYDDLSPATLARFKPTRVAALEPEALRAGLIASVAVLMDEGRAAHLSVEPAVASRLDGWLD